MLVDTAISFAPLGILEADAHHPFPFWQSPFRVREYEAILQSYPRAAIYSTWLGDSANHRSSDFKAFLRERPSFAGRILPVHLHSHAPSPPVRLAYCVFLNNAFEFAHLLESHYIPFCLELYPGGGFAPGQTDSDRMLERLVGLPNFRRVITTQPLTRDYLLQRGYCRPDQVEYIYGGVFRDIDELPLRPRRRYGVDKNVLDVCFAAHRYMPKGEDKGYDLFLEAAQRLLLRSQSVRFHVFGDFTEETIEMRAGAASHFRFYGRQPSHILRGFFAEMDVIVSPNRESTLKAGAFDGFPTGCCIEAGLQGGVVVCTDPLQLNRDYRAGEDLLIVKGDVDELVSCLEQLLHNPAKVRTIGDCGQRTFHRLFSSDEQIAPRLRLLERELTESSPIERRRLHWHTQLLPRVNVRLYNIAELASSIRCLTPDDKIWKQFGGNYNLVQLQGKFLMIACPPPEFGNVTEAVLTLPNADVRPVDHVELQVLPFHPFPQHARIPMYLLLTVLERLHEPAIEEQSFYITPDFRPFRVTLKSSAGRPIHYVKACLYLPEGATTNWNAVVMISDIAALRMNAA